ncbi:MAG: electron transfer flavoprotein-ubiquinone oxidoreductase [Gammaproteobacteria bacterium]|nr:electron transfer flavoprotein-ubiquinone oxidoreductase [Gammaproteobacteria bacterium]
MTERESMDFDVVIVGAGPCGLAAGCRLQQLARDAGVDISVAIVEKGSEIGAHIISGAVLEPTALNELFPDWRKRGAPVATAVAADEFHFLPGSSRAWRVPHAFVPVTARNAGNFIVSLGDLCRWLGRQAEDLGVNLFPGFAAAQLLREGDRVCGVITGDLGRDRAGQPKDGYQAGYELRARYTLFAEGCRGSLGKELMQLYNLRRDSDPQHYGIGLKEVWAVDPARHEEGKVVHTLGWPLDGRTEGGGFLYHAAGGQVYLGLIVALNYRNPWLSPFEEFQRWKQHPLIRRVLEGGKRVSYGARAVNKGGLQSLPRLAFPGGLLAGCEAGFLNGAKIKGSHTAMKTGMLAAESIFAALRNEKAADVLEDFEDRVRASWVHEELVRARNFGPAQHLFGTLAGAAFAWFDQNIARGRLPFTLRNREPDHAGLSRASDSRPIEYQKPDGVLTFDRLSSVYLSSTNHEEDQPSHLRLADPSIPVSRNLPLYAEPAQRYCPAGVYEIVNEDSGPRFQVNAQNCVHCKTCDIKDPAQNIQWVVPEGGGGPNYTGM